MLEPILGPSSSEKVLVFLLAREQGYAREVEAALEDVSRGAGRVRRHPSPAAGA